MMEKDPLADVSDEELRGEKESVLKALGLTEDNFPDGGPAHLIVPDTYRPACSPEELQDAIRLVLYIRKEEKARRAKAAKAGK
jgi:hypothetical protein